MNTRRRGFRKTISIMVMAAMLLTTMMPTWAFGTEMEAGVAEPAQAAAQQEGQTGAEQQGATQPAASGTQPPAAQQSTSQQSDTPAATAEHYIKIQAENAQVGFEKSDKAPYFAAAVKKSDDNAVVKEDKLKEIEEEVEGQTEKELWYQGEMNLLSEDTIGYDSGKASYEVSLQNYFGTDGKGKDGYILDYIEIGGHKVTMPEIEAAENYYIQIPAGKVSGISGDEYVDVYFANNKEDGKPYIGVGINALGDTIDITKDVEVIFAFTDAKAPAGDEKDDGDTVTEDQQAAVDPKATQTGVDTVVKSMSRMTMLLSSSGDETEATSETASYEIDVSSEQMPHKNIYVEKITLSGVSAKEYSVSADENNDTQMDVEIILNSETDLESAFSATFTQKGSSIYLKKYPIEFSGVGVQHNSDNNTGIFSSKLTNGWAVFTVISTSERGGTTTWNITIKVDGTEKPLLLTPNQLELKGVGDTATLTALNAGEDITWKSSDNDVATVDNGVVTSVGLGMATITATSGDQTAECAVTVVEETVLDVSDAQKPHAIWGYLKTITVKGNLLVKEWDYNADKEAGTADDTTVNIDLPSDTAQDATFELLFTWDAQNADKFDIKYNDTSYKGSPLPVTLTDGKAEMTLNVVGGNISCDWTINISIAEDDVVTNHRTTIETGAQYINYPADVWCKEITLVGPAVEKTKVTEYTPENRKIAILLKEDTELDAAGSLTFVTDAVDGNEILKSNIKYNLDNPYSFELENGKATVKLVSEGNSRPAVERAYKIILKNANTAPTIKEDVEDVTTDWETQAVYSVKLSDIFSDADGDELDYTVSVDGTETPFIEEDWSYKANTTGKHTLIFTASDGLEVSEEYKVVLNVKNADGTYDVQFRVPEEITPQFYVNAGYDGEKGDVLGDTLNATKGGSEGGLTTYTVAVPSNVTTVSFRGVDEDGTDWGGMTAAVEASMQQPVTLRLAKGVVDTLFEEKAPASDEVEFRILDESKNYAVSGDSCEEDKKLAYRFLLVAGKDYAYQTVAVGDFAEKYGVREAIAENLSADTTEVKIFSLPIALKEYFSLTVPEGSIVQTGKLNSYFKYSFEESFYQKKNEDGTITHEVEVLPYENSDGSVGGAQFIRVQHPDGVTYWDYETDLEHGSELTITEEMLFIGEDDGFNKDTIFHNFEEYAVDVADIYLSVNKEMYVNLGVSESYKLNVFRNWFAVNNFSNGAVALPDVSYEVIGVDGSGSDVITVTPDEYNSSAATITANKSGTAIVLVTYDAMYHAGALQGALGNDRPQPEKFSAIWPENTGVFVVSVGADGSSIETNMNTDAEHDPLYYVGDEGASFSFTPESGCEVSVARAQLTANSLTYNEFTTDDVSVNKNTGEVTVNGLTTGRHIIRVEKNGVAAYQVVTAKQTTMKITDPEGNVITENTPVDAGTELTVQFGTLYNPVNKLSGIYNTNCAVYYVGQDGTTFEGSAGGNMGYYLFASNPDLHKVTITVPATWDEETYTLTGGLKLGGFGSSGGAHRGVLLYETGKSVQTDAPGISGNPGRLPTITLKVSEGTAIEQVPAEKVELDRTEITLKAGSSTTLKPSVTPENTTDTAFSWESSNEAVAVVQNGTVVGVGEGEAKITVKVGNVSATCTVTVEAKEVEEEIEDTDGIASVYLSISHDDKFLKCDKTGTVMALTKLNVPYFDLEEYGLGKYAYPKTSPNYGKVTALHLYIYAMETCYYGVNPEEAGKGYLKQENIIGTDMLTVSGDAGSLFLEKFWGMDMNLNYYHDYQYPISEGATGATADQILLTDGDIITIGHFTDYGFYDDPTSIFNYIMIGDDTTSATVTGEKHTLSVYRAGANLGASFGTANDPVEMELDVYYAKIGEVASGDVTTWKKLGTTDAKGHLEFDASKLEAGQYTLAVAGRTGTKHTTAICSAPGGIVLTVLNTTDSKAVNDVIALIDKIGDVTLEDESAIKDARAAYDALDNSLKDGVSNYSDLKKAEEAYAILSANELDKAKAQNVDELIAAIGEVTLEDEEAIKKAREAYENLSDTQKLLVQNLPTLVDAEKTLEKLKQPAPMDASVEEIYKATGDYMETLGTPTVNSIGGEWMILGLARSGRDVPAGYYDNVVAYVKEEIDENGRLHPSASTDNSRVILALTAAGINPTNVEGYDLLEGLTDFEYVKKQGINGPIWALIALDSHDYELPVGSTTTRAKLVDYILDAQLADGGWALTGTTADSDMTGMALQALAPYYNTTSEVTAAMDKAVAKLSDMQEDNGAFATVGTITSESTAQVIVALTALGIDPETDERFIKNGNSAIDGLTSFAVSGGGFKHTASGSRNGMATEQGYYALAAYDRFINGKTTLYDMSDVKLSTGKLSGEGTTGKDSADDGTSGTTATIGSGTKAVTKSANIKLSDNAPTEEQLAQGKENHYCEETGVDARDNSNDILPWYIKLNVVKQEITDDQKAKVSEALGGEGEVFILKDIHFINTKDGSEWQPTKPIKIKIPMVDIGDYENAIIVHITDDGKIELIKGTVKDGMIEFEADSFSLYGIAGTNTSINDLLGVEDDGAVIWPWIVIAIIALAAIAYIAYRRKREA